jgi:hypothetical protein
MSTHGGEETWPMTLKIMYTKLDNTRNLIPGKREPPRRKKREKKYKERNICFKVTLIPAQTCKVRVMIQLLFEAFNT